MEPDRTQTVASLPTILLPKLAAFLAVVDAGSFTAAARHTGSDKTVLSRRVKGLEEALGARLLNRTTRTVHVTEAGRRLAEEARDPLSDVMAALARTRAPGHVEGTVRLASAESLAQSVLVPVLAQLRAAHPKLRVELSARDTFTPLVEGGHELAIRVGRMPDSSLIARKLARWRYLLVASPEWIDAHPEVRSPGELREHWLLWGDGAAAQRWRFRRGDEELDVRMDRSAIVYDSSPLLVESARASLGVAAMPPFSVEREVAEGSLVRVLPEWHPVHELGIYGVTPHRTLLPTRVQVVLETVRAKLEERAAVWDTMT